MMRFLRNKETIAVAVLASFVPGKPPVPHKVKFKDHMGQEYTFVVDRLDGIESYTPYIKYKCVTFFGDHSERYALILFKSEAKWELRNEDHYIPEVRVPLPY